MNNIITKTEAQGIALRNSGPESPLNSFGTTGVIIDADDLADRVASLIDGESQSVRDMTDLINLLAYFRNESEAGMNSTCSNCGEKFIEAEQELKEHGTGACDECISSGLIFELDSSDVEW